MRKVILFLILNLALMKGVSAVDQPLNAPPTFAPSATSVPPPMPAPANNQFSSSSEPSAALNEAPSTEFITTAPPPAPTSASTSPPVPTNASVMAPAAPQAPSETNPFQETAPLNVPPPSPNATNGGSATISPQVQSEVDQFQKWLKGSTSQQNLRLNDPALTAEGIPPPPSAAIPPPPKKKVQVKRRYRPVRMSSDPDAPVVESPPLTYEQEKRIMRSMVPRSSLPKNPDSEIAFNGMMQQNMPLSPDQVIRLRQLIDTSQRAAAIPPTIPPKPVSTTLMINLAPGSTPPAIRLAQGYISSLVFVDSTGTPWPVAAYDIGDPKIVNIQWDGKSNIIMMQATSPYSSGNLVIRLVGLETPVTLELVSGQRVVDYRTDIHVPGIGPNSKDLPTGTGLPESANQLLLSVLDGVAPPGSKQLKVVGGDAQAWALGDKMFLRTRFTVLSPGWIGKMSSPDGMMAYEIQLTSSVLISQYGNPIEIKIEGL